MPDLLGPDLPEDFAGRPALRAKSLPKARRPLPAGLRLGLILTGWSIAAYLPLIGTALFAGPGAEGRPMFLGCVAFTTALLGFVIGIPRSFRFLIDEAESPVLGIVGVILNLGQFPLHLFLMWFTSACLGYQFKP